MNKGKKCLPIVHRLFNACYQLRKVQLNSYLYNNVKLLCFKFCQLLKDATFAGQNLGQKHHKNLLKWRLFQKKKCFQENGSKHTA